MALPTERESDKMTAQELKAAIETAKTAPVTTDPVTPAVPPTITPVATGVIKEQVTPAATPPVTQGVVTEPVKTEPVVTAPVTTVKADNKTEITFNELAKKQGFKSADDLATSYLRLRRERDKEKQQLNAVTPPPTPLPPTTQSGYGQVIEELPDDDMPVSAKQLKAMERRMLENTIIAAKMMAEKAVQPLQERTRHEMEDAEIKNLALSDPLYCTPEGQAEIDKVIVENAWIKDVPNRQTVAWQIARGRLMINNQIPTIDKQVTQQVNQQTPVNQSGYVESGGAASTMTPISTIDTKGKSAQELKNELRKQGVKFIPGANVIE